MAAEDVLLRLRLQGEKQVQAGLNKTGDSADSMGGRFRKAGRIAAAGVAAIGVIAAKVAKDSIEAASDVGESLSKNQQLFGASAKGIERYSKNAASALGISQRAALEYTGTFGNLARATGFTEKESAGLSKKLTTLGADLASFNNTSVEEALDALRSGLVGESEPLRRYGVSLSAAAIEAEAFAKGIAKPNSKLTAQQKALAIVSLTMRQTKVAQGDFARTSGSLANQQKILTAEWENAKVTLGQKLLPVAVKAATKLADFIEEMRNGTGAGGRFADAIKSVADKVSGFASALYRNREAIIAVVAGVGTYVAVSKGYAAATFIAAVATGGFSGAFWALNAAMTANPVGLVIVAIAALVAGFVYAWRNSQTFRNIVAGAFRVVRTVAAQAFDILTFGLRQFLTGMGKVAAVASKLPGMGWLKAVSRESLAAAAKLSNISKTIRGIPDRKKLDLDVELTPAGIAALSKLEAATGRTIGSIAPPVGARAAGGPVDARKPYLVGERGPELVSFGRRGYVHDAKTSAGMMAGSDRPIVIHTHVMLNRREIALAMAEHMATEAAFA